jgi:hypothetical protein
MSTMMQHSAQHAARPPESPRFVQVFADLMPEEVVSGRRAHKKVREVIIALFALVVLLGAWYAVTVIQTARAGNELTQTQAESVALQHEVQGFGPLISAQSQSAAIQATLARIMTGDLQWAALLGHLGPSGSSSVKLTTVTGTMTTSATSTGSRPNTGGMGVLNTSGQRQVGTLTINGTAADKNAIAAYTDGLTKITGLVSPFPASVSGKPGDLTFSINVILTSDALGGRFSATGPNGQGGH